MGAEPPTGRNPRPLCMGDQSEAARSRDELSLVRHACLSVGMDLTPLGALGNAAPVRAGELWTRTSGRAFMEKFECSMCEYTYDPAKGTRAAGFRPAPRSRIYPITGPVRSVTQGRTCSRRWKNESRRDDPRPPVGWRPRHAVAGVRRDHAGKHGTTYNSYLVRGRDKVALIDASKGCSPRRSWTPSARPSIPTDRLHGVQPSGAGSFRCAGRCPRRRAQCAGGRDQAGQESVRAILNREVKPMVVGEGDRIDLGGRTLRFISAPFLHWPDTMFTYLEEDQVLFSGDFLGAHYCDPRLFNDLIVNYDEAFRVLLPGDHAAVQGVRPPGAGQDRRAADQGGVPGPRPDPAAGHRPLSRHVPRNGARSRRGAQEADCSSST